MDRVFGPVYVIRKNSSGDYIVAHAESGNKNAEIKVRGGGKIVNMLGDDTPLDSGTIAIIMAKVSQFTAPSPTTPIDLTRAEMHQEKKTTPSKKNL